ncbi:SEL1-like repeat protein [Derxia gummosa]|uniref:SEL1-like repeat protein n=1 Tax=Derxia gummosa DSM 723 TaxID=1121388 RepID=A0A8B6X9L6_9BURK|nr:SEL1-like repeat protein [Derxia gummosa]
MQGGDGFALTPRRGWPAPGADATRNVALAVSLALHAALFVFGVPPRPAAPEAERPAPIVVRLLAPPPAQPPPEPRAAAKPASHPAAKPAAPARRPARPRPTPTSRSVIAASRPTASPVAADGEDGGAVGDLNYRRFYDENPKHPMRCMVGHVAQSSGDHESAVYIYSDCAAHGDNFSLLSLAVYYEVGVGGLPRDPAKAAEIFHRIATGKAEAYAANGMFYYGLVLYYGLGVTRDEPAGLDWLARASDKGDRDAAEFIRLAEAGTVPDSSRYFRR